MIIYRLATMQDWPAIATFIAASAYYNPVNPRTLGGFWLVAETEGRLVGTIWAFHSGPQACVDYWCGTAPLVAARLLRMLEDHLRQLGVRYVRGMIAVANLAAGRLAAGYGHATLEGPYMYAVKEI